MNFISTENTKMLWDVIQKTTTKMDYNNHQNKMNEFNQTQIISNSLNKEELLEINKKYITHIVEFIKESKSTTFEELQKLKRDKFNEELNKKQQDFSNMMIKPIPPPLNFEDEKDKPICEMEDLINKTIAQRSYDIEQISKNIPPPPSNFIKIDSEPTELIHPIVEIKKSISWKEDKEEDIQEQLNFIKKELSEIKQLLKSKIIIEE
jgi:hypothetical protein